MPCENINIPDGTLPREKVNEFCANYEKKINDLGGIDIQILVSDALGISVSMNQAPVVKAARV